MVQDVRSGFFIAVSSLRWIEHGFSRVRERTKRGVYVCLGCVSLVLGILGIPLPLLPTTPFLLLSAFCFARGSERLHDWLLHHERLGPPIRRWQEHRAISRDAKWMGTVSLLAMIALSVWLNVSPWILALQAVALIGVGTFLWTRPEPPETSSGS